MKTYLARAILAIVLAGGALSALAQNAGVSADHSVGTVPLSSFADLAPPQLWQRINNLEFWAIPRDPPAGYYATVNTSSPATLRQSLHDIIKGHHVYPYTNSSKPGSADHQVDTWDIIAVADAHPQEPIRVLDIYHNNTLNRQLKGGEHDPHYDREHSWPKSLGFPDDQIENAAYSDCHHLFAAYSSYNSSRSNKPYGRADDETPLEKPTVENVGRGGALTPEPDSSNYSFDKLWQTWLGRRGDVARAMFYMDVRYEGGQSEPDLQLTADLSKIQNLNVWSTGGIAYMGLLPTLVEWHQQDPVDDLERRRDAVVFLFQGNRNPFIDHPEWVGVLFGSGTLPTSQPTTGTVWINELHYDNQGADTGEFVEVAGTAGTNLTGWSLVAYNGNGGRVCGTVALSGTIPAQDHNFGTLAFDFPDLQNGEPDGIALVDGAGRVVQFISYEGVFTASDGPADDLVSTDIGVSETGSTPVGHSLQLTGQGRKAADFQWQPPRPSSRGSVNAGQQFAAP